MSSENMKAGLMTRFEIPRQPLAGINSRWYFMGSCFSEHIASMLGSLGFSSDANPFGILYNPHSLAHAMERIATEYRYSVHDLIYSGGDFVSLSHHGSFRDKDSDKLVQRINNANETAREALSHADFLAVTLGTSWVWVHRDPPQIAGNCHKIPSHEFTRRLLTEQEIRNELFRITQYMHMINPQTRVIFTVSPVKHLREGIVENSISKARLISALASFTEDHPEAMYFPAFEIVNDELRDHRFYADDLAHPTGWTIRYIFERFAETCFDERAIEYMSQAMRYARMTSHRIQTSDADKIAAWEQKKRDALNALKTTFPDKTEWPEG